MRAVSTGDTKKAVSLSSIASQGREDNDMAGLQPKPKYASTLTRASSHLSLLNSWLPTSH